MNPASQISRVSIEMRHKTLLSILGAIALLLLFLVGLEKSFLFDVDEGAFTEATREMLASNDWLHTTLNGVDRFDKPIGVYWLQSLSASLFGMNEFAFRLPSALSGWLASLAMARFVNRHLGFNAACLAAVVAATSLGPWAMARTATADALLGLFFVLIFLDLWRALESSNPWYGRKVALWVALGFLVKGPVAVVVPAGTLLILALLSSVERRRVGQIILDPWSWCVFIFVASPWYLYAYMRHGQLFIDGFLFKHNLDRFAGSLEGHSGHWTYFLVALPLLWFPWSFMWFKALFDIRSCRQVPLLKFSWLWFTFVFVFFTIANTKLPHYLLYAGPAMCLIIVHATLSANRPTWIVTCLLGFSGFFALLLLPQILQNHLEWITDPYYKLLIASSSSLQVKPWLVAFALVFIGFAVTNAIYQRLVNVQKAFSWQTGFILFACTQSVAMSLLVLPWWSHAIQSPVFLLADRFKHETQTIVQWGVHLPSFATYRQQIAPRREPNPGDLALVKNTSKYWPETWVVLRSEGPLSVIQRPHDLGVKP